MTKEQAIKQVWEMVTDGGNIREAKEIAYEYDIFMEFDETCIVIEDDVFYLNN